MSTIAGSKVLFFGTPRFAVPTLELLADHGAHLLVVTMPDRPAGRSGTPKPPAVKVAALERKLPILQPQKLDAAFLDAVRSWAPDVAVVAAYGKIFKPELLAIPRFGFVNVHPSLLPRHRGANPIAAAILAGDATTGVTIMQLDPGLDTGPVFASVTHPLRGDETTGQLSDDLARLGATLLLKTLEQYLAGSITPTPQPTEGVTVTKLVKREDGRIDASRAAAEIERAIRAFTPWPGTWTTVRGRRLKILGARLSAGASRPEPAGTIVSASSDSLLGLVAGDGRVLLLTHVQWEGKRPVEGTAFFHGNQNLAGSHIDDATTQNLAR